MQLKVFFSYSRSDASVAAAVAEDIRSMGHAAWYDREVAGGQAWWNAILRQIRECDLFVFILTPRSLESQACRAEFSYASRLQKRILPVLCREGVKVNLLPPEFSAIQFVDYRAQDKQAAYAMVRALHSVPESAPLPHPLPAEPPVPTSYLGDLRAQIESDQELTLARQRDLLFELKRRLRDAESCEDALDLMRLLRGREELLASIAEEINAILDRRTQERNDEPAGHQAPAEENAVGYGSPPPEIDLTGGSKGLEALVKCVAATSQSWVLMAGEDRLSISLESGKLVLAAAVFRKAIQRFKAMGWSQASILKQRWGPYLLVIFTCGLALLHKQTRESFWRISVFVKRFSLSQQREAALEVMETFRVLSPNSTRLFNWQGRLTQGDYAVFRGIADAIKLGLNKMAEALSRNSNRKIVVAFCFHFPAAACSLSVGSFNLHRFGRFRCRI